MITKSRNRHVVALLLSLIFVLVFAACGSASANSSTLATATSSSPAAATAAPALDSATVSAPTTASADPNQATSAFVKLNLNTASADDFLTIPGLPSRMVKEFQEYRPYVSIQQFEKEIGKYVSADQVAEYEKYVYVPISANDSDAATLQQISGLDANEAATLIAARPFASNDAFLTQLAQYVSADQLSAAKALLSNQ